jgi:hypothetical protein
MKRILSSLFFILFVFAQTSDAVGNITGMIRARPRIESNPGETQRGGQVGATCVASPFCPDCARGGNVCRTVKQFFGGITVLAAKRYMIDQCRRANGLDYCGGSYGCVRQKNWSPKEQERYRQRYGGGCYKSCDKSVVCYLDSR